MKSNFIFLAFRYSLITGKRIGCSPPLIRFLLFSIFACSIMGDIDDIRVCSILPSRYRNHLWYASVWKSLGCCILECKRRISICSFALLRRSLFLLRYMFIFFSYLFIFFHWSSWQSPISLSLSLSGRKVPWIINTNEPSKGLTSRNFDDWCYRNVPMNDRSNRAFEISDRSAWFRVPKSKQWKWL